jgi:ABC-2 type transport system ATP-binding protein
MIDAEHLRRSYGSTLAVDDLSFQAAPGEILGFLGPNGAGKSTTVKMLTGMLRPDGGRARIGGFDVVEQPLEVKRRIGYVPESGALYETLTAAEYLELVACLHHLDVRAASGRIDELLDLFDLREARHKRLSGFSKGMKQKTLIASALIHNPDYLFLDEPLNGLDANMAMVIKELLRKLAAQGKVILFCSHILEVVERICTRIVVIDHGHVIAQGTAPEILEQTGTRTLEEAFARLTVARDASDVTAEFLAALEQA